MDAQIKDEAWLAWIEQLAVPPASNHRENELPRSLFHCRLDDQPDHLVPARLLLPEYWECLTDRPFFLNPACFFPGGGEVPTAVPTAGFAAGKVAWIRDPGSEAWLPFWLGHELGAMLADTQPGDPEPPALSPQARRILIAAKVLVPDDYDLQRRQRWAEIVSVTKPQFQAQGYAPVGGLLHPFHISALRRYYRHQLRTGKLRLGDSQSPRRYVSYNDPVARFFHQQMTAAVSAFAGESVKPSYVYLASYQEGATLPEHTDREQCEFSVTLCLDYAPEPRHATPWPLYLHKKPGKVTVFQAIGDALLYRGCQLPHSREAVPKGHTSTSIFFHYVREDFAGSLH